MVCDTATAVLVRVSPSRPGRALIWTVGQSTPAVQTGNESMSQDTSLSRPPLATLEQVMLTAEFAVKVTLINPDPVAPSELLIRRVN